GDENVPAVLAEMNEAITRADSITASLLNFAASKQLVMKGEDLNALIEDTLRLVRHELAQNNVNVIKEFHRALPRVGVDKTQIQQVFVNLFVNALQAMKEHGTLLIRTSVRQMTKSTHSEGSRKSDRLWMGKTAVVAEVEDSGTGIPEENLAKIFDPFFTTKPTGVGTGLGLSVSKKIIELHGDVLF